MDLILLSMGAAYLGAQAVVEHLMDQKMRDPTKWEVMTAIIIGYWVGVFLYTPSTCAGYDESLSVGDNLLNAARDGNVVKLKYVMKWRLYSPWLWPLCWFPTCHHCRMMSEYGYSVAQGFEQATRNGHWHLLTNCFKSSTVGLKNACEAKTAFSCSSAP